MAEIMVGAIEPISIFSSQVSDLIQITDAFSRHENLRAIDYLRAAQTVRENLNAIVHVTVSSIMSEAMQSDRITPDDMRAHTAEMEADDTPIEMKIERALMRIAKNFNIDLDDLPGDSPGDTD